MSTETRRVVTPVRGRAGRHERRRATRERVVQAASALFVRDGYLATTMAGIAAEAGVAVQSLYLIFGSKLEILKAALDVAVVGDFDPVPLLEREWARRLAETPDGPEAVRLFISEVKRILGRTYPIYAVVQAAAAGEPGEILAENKLQRHEGHGVIAQALSRKPGFAQGLSIAGATDMIYGLASEDLYGLLVADRGWSPDKWERWCADILVGILFPPADD
ncbi:MAG: TetR/AcrR family transcriptional regulator [Candidatus Dormibacteraeota bacterium]|nr:TetR/AcrR family transcriptional regulator [Candidatus Dormibacteraeota bacterium]